MIGAAVLAWHHSHALITVSISCAHVRNPHCIHRLQIPPHRRYLRFRYNPTAQCLPSACGTTTLNIGEVGLYAIPSPTTNLVNGPDTIVNADSMEMDADYVTHFPFLAVDGDISSWFGSASTGAAASLEVDLGAAAGPYFDDLLQLDVYNRCGAAGRV
jgi:hypothetical protein